MAATDLTHANCAKVKLYSGRSLHCSDSTYFKFFLKIVNGFVQIERWTSPFKILSFFKDYISQARKLLVAAFI
jgi:plasmid rolling circle replication initiator protein Rep